MDKQTNSLKNFVILEKWMAEDLDVNITEFPSLEVCTMNV